jgi:hypothetical protein
MLRGFRATKPPKERADNSEVFLAVGRLLLSVVSKRCDDRDQEAAVVSAE